MMDFDDFRSILENSGVDVWTLIDTAISVASLDFEEFKLRRDGIVEGLYVPVGSRCRNCDHGRHEKPSGDETPKEKHRSPEEAWIVKENNCLGSKQGLSLSPESLERDDEYQDYGGSIDDEQRKVLAIKERLEDSDQPEETLVDLLQSLADMDITFKALKETDIGRHVNRLRKHSSNEIRRLVKQLVRKWKDLVDEWVRLNTTGESTASAIIADGDSPQQVHQKSTKNDHHQVPDFAYSPNPHNGNSASDKNNSDLEPKARIVHRREPPTKPTHPFPVSASVTPNKQREPKQSYVDPEKLASARKRLHENYQEAQNAKKQRTIQVMDIHDIPKPKNAYFAKNRGGGVQAKHW